MSLFLLLLFFTTTSTLITCHETRHQYIQSQSQSHSKARMTSPHTHSPSKAHVSSTNNVDDVLLFAYFGGKDQTETLHYAYSIDGTHWTPMAQNLPVAKCDIENVTIRDPYIHVDQSGHGYHLVATNGNGFGHDSNIVYAYSNDLIYWEWTLIDLMSSIKGWQAVWAPEFKWDPVSNQYMIFWGGLVYADEHDNCTDTNSGRWKFWYTMTPDFTYLTVWPPQILFDPGCYIDGMGGIDATIVMDEHSQWNIVYKDARGSSESTRGVRRALSTAGLTGPYTSISQLITQPLVEAPEAIQWQGNWLVYYDCTFAATPSGWPRPPYGVSSSYNLHTGLFREIDGSCTGNSTLVAFPYGATHGSFFPLSITMIESLLNHFGQ